MIAVWQIIPALRMGNTVVIKPSEYTSIGTLEMVRLMADILPVGVINSVTGKGDVGSRLVDHPDVNKIMFTGSTETGLKIAARAAARLVPVTLELGGNDAAVVLEDAEPSKIAADLFWGAFLNGGQTCACAKRIYVHESIHDELINQFKTLLKAMPVGDGMKPGIAFGPLQNKVQLDKVVHLLDDAKSEGATVYEGYEPSEKNGYFMPLTIVTGIKDGCRLVDEEQFGPVLPIISYSNLDDVIKAANKLAVGLGASVWSSNIQRAQAVAIQLEAGTVWINKHGAVHPLVPFGGLKKSGMGVEFGVEGLKAVCQTRVITTFK
ncbi:Phenylacetaldehyde dehydrogenase [compost metagenome]